MSKKRIALIIALLGLGLLLGASTFFVGASWKEFGLAAEGERLERMIKSPQYDDGVFVNKQAMWNDYSGSVMGLFRASDHLEPKDPILAFPKTKEVLSKAPEGTRITWLGHSTVLMEIAGKRILTDPIFGKSPFPLPSFGPQRWYEPPIALSDLQPIDVVLISHDHYDHLDTPTIEEMSEWKETTFITPLGVGAHLEYWGVPSNQVVEMDWWEEREFGDLKIAATPARHASGRHLLDQMRTLWAGNAIMGPQHRLMFSGDTGLFDDMEKIGKKYGPFDLVMIEVGAYDAAWPDWHIGPEQAIVAQKMMGGKALLPIHWGLFNLALHGWTEPIERVWVAAEKNDSNFVTPRPGQPILIGELPKPERWWPEVPWKTAEQDPITATKNGSPDNRY